VEGTTLKASSDLVPDDKHLTDEAIKKLRADSERFQQEDEPLVSLIEATHSAEAAIRKAEDRLASHGSKGAQGTDRNAIAEQIAALGRALETQDVDRIRECTRLLEASLSPGQGFDFFTPFSDLFTTPPGRTVRPSPTTAKSRTGPPPGRVQHSQIPPKVVARAAASQLPLGKIFGGGDFTLDPNLCFVLMPFAETFQPIYDDHIRPVIQSEGLTCLRADEIRGTSLITRDIWEKINRARFLIADLTGQNPNVFYEVGLAHALGKDVLLLTQTMTDVPFDLRAMRCIVYSYTPRGMKEMESALRGAVSALMKSR
jgi:hypothetical protein